VLGDFFEDEQIKAAGLFPSVRIQVGKCSPDRAAQLLQDFGDLS